MPNGPARLPRRLWFGVALVLVVVSTLLAALDYRRVMGITRDLAIAQARGLAMQVEQELAGAAYGERTVRELMRDHLFGIAWSTNRLVDAGGAEALRAEGIALEAGASALLLYGGDGRLKAAAGWSLTLADSTVDDVLAALDASLLGEIAVGFLPGPDGERHYTVAVEGPDGGAVIAAMRDTRLRQWREYAGLSAIIGRLEVQPAVDYALIMAPGPVILAATSTIPSWVGGGEDPFLRDAVADTGFGADFRRAAGETVFEAHTPLTGMEGPVLRLGLDTGELEAIRGRAILALALRAVFLVLLAGLGLALVFVREHRSALAIEAARIRREVERLEAEKAVRERQEALGKLAGGVAHEVRNPLNTVQMVAQRLAGEFTPTGDEEEFRTLLEHLRSETGRIGRIIEQFLQFARPPRAQKREEELEPVLRRTAELFAPSCEAAGVDFAVELERVPAFPFDPDQVAQAVSNLLRNALQAVKPGEGRILLGAEVRGPEAVIRVEDNGPGVPPEERQRIFHLYYTTRAEGTGIGLPLVFRIADEHGGRIEVDESPLGGARFTMTLGMDEEKA